MKQQWNKTMNPLPRQGKKYSIISFVMCLKVLQIFTALQTCYTHENEHGTWNMDNGRGNSCWKASFSGSMFVSGSLLSKKKSNWSQEDTSNIPKSKYERIPFIPTGAKVSGFGVCSDNCVYFKGFFCKSKNHRRGVPTGKKNSQLHA